MTNLIYGINIFLFHDQQDVFNLTKKKETQLLRFVSLEPFCKPELGQRHRWQLMQWVMILSSLLSSVNTKVYIVIGFATRNVMLCNKKRDGKPLMVPIWWDCGSCTRSHRGSATAKVKSIARITNVLLERQCLARINKKAIKTIPTDNDFWDLRFLKCQKCDAAQSF